MRIDVLGVGFDNLTMAEAVERGMELVRSPGPHYVVTPNPEIVEVCREDSGARAAVNGADLVLPDGIGVIKGAAMLGTPLKERTPGVEFATHLMDKLAEEGKSLYLLGAKPGVAEQAGAKLAAAHPGLRIAGTHDGYFKEDGPVVAAIRQSGADVVFVCLGAQAGEVDGEKRRRHRRPAVVRPGGQSGRIRRRGGAGPKILDRPRAGVVLPPVQGAPPHRPDDEAAAVFNPCQAGEETQMSGKLIVFEGTDGSGKATQAKLLCETLAQRGIAYREIDFPRYGNPFAEPANLYLHGALGNRPGDVNAYAASVLYAVDRFASYKEDWGGFYEEGGIVVANRYTTSNAVHQASKLPEGERQAFLDWLFDLEYGRMGLPAPDLVLYLDLPTEVSEKMLRHREQATATAADIHEQDGAYLRRCREGAREIARDLGWSVIDCAAGDAPRTVEDIRREVLSRVEPLLN